VRPGAPTVAGGFAPGGRGGELAGSAPQFLEAARRFGKAGLLPADVVERIVPAAP
jgi:hypothetical protein